VLLPGIETLPDFIGERNMKYQAITLYPSISKGIELLKPTPHYDYPAEIYIF